MKQVELDKIIDELDSILMYYADEGSYTCTKRECYFVTNNVTEETFTEFDGDSKLANRGLQLVKKLRDILEGRK